MITLYGYWRSSAAYRVRIALNLLDISHEQQSVHLVKNGGEQHSLDYQALNPNQLVPTLVDSNGVAEGEEPFVLNQSMAIIDYLDEVYGDGALYPANVRDKAVVKALAQDIACDIHPLNNLRVLQYLAKELEVTDQQKTAWYHHWINTGFASLEKQLERFAGLYCFGDKVTVADLCLMPQVYNARRFNIDLTGYPKLLEVVANLEKLKAFEQALPENQPDAQ